MSIEDRKYLKWNKNFNQVSGFSNEEIQSMKPADFYLGEDLHRMEEATKEVLQKSHSFLRASLITKSGKQIPYEYNGVLLKDYKQKTDCICVIGRDISERLRMEKAEVKLITSEQIFTQFMDHVPAAAFIKDKNLVTLYANRYLRDVFGGEKWIGKSTTELFPEEIAKQMIEADKRALKNGLQIAIEKVMDISGNLNTYQTFKFPIKRKKQTDLLGGLAFDITKRQQIEIALRESEERYRRLSEASSEGIVIHDTAKIIDANQAFLKMFGYDFAEIIEISGFDLISPKDREKVQKDILSGIEKPYEAIGLKKDGTSFLIRVHPKSIPYEGSMVRVAGVRDITEQKKIEEQLQSQADLLKYVSDAIIMTDLDFKITGWNRTAEIMYGWREEEVLGKEVGELLQQKLPYHQEQDVVKEFLAKGIWRGEAIHQQKDNKIINVLASVTLVKNKDGKPIAVLAVNKDITELKQTEKTLRQSENYLKEAQIIAKLSYWTLDPETEEVTGSDELFRIFGLARTEATLAKFAEVVHPEDREYDLYHIQRGIEHGIPWDIEHRLLLKDGVVKYVHAKGEAVTNKSGKVIHLIGTVQDITERKETEEIKKELEERRENFIYMTSHELRTPLTVCIGYCEFLLKNYVSLSNDQTLKTYNSIRRNLGRLEKLVTDVKTTIQLDQGFFQIEKQNIDFCDFFEELLDPYKYRLGNVFSFESCNEGMKVTFNGDEERLKQAFENVIENAIEQTSIADRKIFVKIKSTTSKIEVSIHDNGACIESHNLESIFEQFVSIPTDMSVSGTGIGLYLTREIITAHEGTIIASSPGVGKGATFTIVIPIGEIP